MKHKIHAHISGTQHKNGVEYVYGKAYYFDERFSNGWGSVTAKVFQITADEAIQRGWCWHSNEHQAKVAAECEAVECSTVIALTPEFRAAM